MKVIVYNTDTQTQKYRDYFRADNQPVTNLPSNIKVYGIVEDTLPSYDGRTHRVIRNEEMSDTPHPEYNFLGTFHISYSLEQLSDSTISANLDVYVGEYLDEEYPLWKRTKYLYKMIEYSNKDSLTAEEQSEYDYISRLENWANNCRTLRDTMVSDLVNNNTLPDFELFPIIPTR